MSSQHSSLRERTNQHLAKNTLSKIDDKLIEQAIFEVMNFLKTKYYSFMENYCFQFEKSIDLKTIIDFIKTSGIRSEFVEVFDKKIIPDGGVLYLINKKTQSKSPLVFSEMKHQGTNDERMSEGKKKQAVGNAIERLGKNLTAIKAMMNHHKITPFVCFGWGCDFNINEKTVLAKVWCLNEFYPLNRINIFKKDGGSTHNSFSPVSMYFREQKWTKEEVYEIIKEIADTSLRYYLY